MIIQQPAMIQQPVKASNIPKEIKELRLGSETTYLLIESYKSVDPHSTLKDLNEIIQKWDKYKLADH